MCVDMNLVVFHVVWCGTLLWEAQRRLLDLRTTRTELLNGFELRVENHLFLKLYCRKSLITTYLFITIQFSDLYGRHHRFSLNVFILSNLFSV